MKLRRLWFIALVAMWLIPPRTARAAYTIKCDTGGDAMGWTIATGGDFDGDGVADFAVSAPCAHIRNSPKAGKVTVYSGKTRKKILAFRGRQTEEWFGVGLAFVHDLDGDGRDELAVGSPGYDAEFATGDPANPIELVKNAGRVSVFRKERPRRIRKITGDMNESGFGESLVGLADLNGDGRPDFAVGASEDRVTDGARKGRVYVVSGAPGSAILGIIEGEKNHEGLGSSLDGGSDLNGDGMADIIAGSGLANINNATESGVVRGYFAPVTGAQVFMVSGAAGDRMGSGLAITDDHDGDSRADFITGSPGADDLGLKKAGGVTLFSSNGSVLFNVGDSVAQENASFGSAVASIGDVNRDGVTDFAAAAVDMDTLGVDSTWNTDAGRVAVLSGVNGHVLWSRDGTLPGMALGTAVKGGLDLNKDGTPDVLVGATGAAPAGRRGAGILRLLSGNNGWTIKTFTGRRGLETRVFVVGRGSGSALTLQGFDYRGRPRSPNTQVLQGATPGDYSVAVVGDEGKPIPGEVLVAVGTGSGTADSTVTVLDADKKSRVLDSFSAFPDLPDVGVNLAAGRIQDDVVTGLGRTIVAAQADSATGDVLVRIFDVFADGNKWSPVGEFLAYRRTDAMAGSLPIDAGGATIAVGDVTGDKREDIIVGTVSGVPLVRIFDQNGTKLAEWLAYDPRDAQGVSVAVINANGAGKPEIVTCPRQGAPLIRVVDATGAPVNVPGQGVPIEFLGSSATFTQGLNVTAADVDLDGIDEILVVPRKGQAAVVKAFEIDGTPVPGFPDLKPFTQAGAAIAATNTFVRR